MEKTLLKYEHESLQVNPDGSFNRTHLNSLIALNNSAKNKYFSIIPDGIKFKQYVGVIQIDGLTIEILPKADRNNDKATEAKWQPVLLEMLKVCGRVKINPYEEAHLNKGGLNLLELYFNMYLDEVQSLLRNGLVKQYRKEEGNLKALKGKLDFNKNIRHNLVHKERFYTIHQVYDVDHTLHQVLAQALTIVGQFSSSLAINDKLRRVQLHFPEVKNIVATKQLLDSIHLNRKTAPYKRALELARLIILNYSPNVSKGADKMISILFDMNKLWEEYIVAKLRSTKEEKVKVLGKQGKSFWGSNRLEPDIVLSIEGKTYIIDTKWKIPTDSTPNSDLRQMYAYGRYWNAESIMLLYPGNSGTTKYISFENEEYYLPDPLDKEKVESIKHQCRKGVVSVLSTDPNEKLNPNIGAEVLKLLRGE